MRDALLKITAAPAGQPGSLIGLLPTPPNLSANAGCDCTAIIARALITTTTVPNRVRWAMDSPLVGRTVTDVEQSARLISRAAPNRKTIDGLGRCALGRKNESLR